MKRVKSFLFFFLFFLLFLEIFGFAAYKSKILEISHLPKLYLEKGYLPNDASGCHCYYVNQEKGIIDVSAATPYNITYYKESNCCNGWVKSRDLQHFPKGSPINQRGRWNWNTTNTKMYRPIGLIVPNRVPQCPATAGNCYPNPITTIGARQSRNMFLNTHKMSQKKLFSYLARNRIYLNR